MVVRITKNSYSSIIETYDSTVQALSISFAIRTPLDTKKKKKERKKKEKKTGIYSYEH